MIPLALAPEGEMHKVRKITGTDKTRLHLQEMGFVVGAMARIVSSLGDNMIVAVGDARVAISRELAQRIMV
jgi:ferrous iron transport protein A